MDKRAIATYTIISDIKSHIKKIEDNLENTDILVEQTEQLEWEFPEDIVELHAMDENEFFHTDDEVSPLENEETHAQTHQRQNIQNQEESEIPNRLSQLYYKLHLSRRERRRNSFFTGNSFRIENHSRGWTG